MRNLPVTLNISQIRNDPTTSNNKAFSKDNAFLSQPRGLTVGRGYAFGIKEN
jgi:hypothetical protein